mmetsp:Transcript_36581/g.72330  ORF Transcript_36581/g.72330 Transcript_36581/m.72330 type:complete len:114 (-) Transcript_36581:97-438(-)
MSRKGKARQHTTAAKQTSQQQPNRELCTRAAHASSNIAWNIIALVDVALNDIVGAKSLALFISRAWSSRTFEVLTPANLAVQHPFFMITFQASILYPNPPGRERYGCFEFLAI